MADHLPLIEEETILKINYDLENGNTFLDEIKRLDLWFVDFVNSLVSDMVPKILSF